MEVVFKDDDLQEEHDRYYNEKDEDGNYVNTAYREQYDLLNNSKEIYNVSFGNSKGDATGDFSYNGSSFDIKLETSGEQSLITRLSHEFQHGVQFENGQMGFFSSDGSKWNAFNYDITDETNAWDVSLKIAPSSDYINSNGSGFSTLGKYSHLNSQMAKESFLRTVGYASRKKGPLNNINTSGNELNQVLNKKGWAVKYNLWSN